MHFSQFVTSKVLRRPLKYRLRTYVIPTHAQHPVIRLNTLCALSSNRLSTVYDVNCCQHRRDASKYENKK